MQLGQSLMPPGTFSRGGDRQCWNEQPVLAMLPYALVIDALLAPCFWLVVEVHMRFGAFIVATTSKQASHFIVLPVARAP